MRMNSFAALPSSSGCAISFCFWSGNSVSSQSAVFRLGSRPEWHQTDNSTAATHDLATGKRGFNADYLALMTHLGMKPRTIAVGASEQNGDVEASNGALKRRLVQHLLLRGHRDFESRDAYETFV